MLIFKVIQNEYEKRHIQLAFGKNVSPLNKNVLTVTVFAKFYKNFVSHLGRKMRSSQP